jgi:hypothetical protein
LRSRPGLAKAAGSHVPARLPRVSDMSAILMILAFIVVIAALNLFEFGRID